MSMEKGVWRRNNRGRLVRIRQPKGGQMVEHLKEKVAPTKAALTNGMPENALNAVLEQAWSRMSVADRIRALDPRKS